MGQLVDFLQLGNRHRRVNLGRLETGVAEQLLDVTDVGPVLQHEGGAGVAEQMAGTGVAQVGLADVGGDEMGEVARMQRAVSVPGQEQRPLCGIDRELRAAFPQVKAAMGLCGLSCCVVIAVGGLAVTIRASSVSVRTDSVSTVDRHR